METAAGTLSDSILCLVLRCHGRVGLCASRSTMSGAGTHDVLALSATIAMKEAKSMEGELLAFAISTMHSTKPTGDGTSV
jgi:hypothetical protein